MRLRITILTIMFVACRQNNTQSDDTKNNTLTIVSSSIDSSQSKLNEPLQNHTFPTITRDEFPVTNDMFGYGGPSSSYEIQSGNVFSNDQVWFSNDTLNQTLIIGLYTDYYKPVFYNFINTDIPSELIQRLELHQKNGDFADNNSKIKSIKGFLNQAKPISQKYLTTSKGFKLGDNNKNLAVKIYGKPDSIKSQNNYEIYYWNFLGDAFQVNDTVVNKPFADGFGYFVTMFYKQNKLFAMILVNEIP